MFLIDKIRFMWYAWRIWKFENDSMLCDFRYELLMKIEDAKEWIKLKFESKQAKAERLAREEEEHKQFIKESNERLALLLMLACLNDADAMNKACDYIKQEGLVEDYV